jgi:hypothetical protein
MAGRVPADLRRTRKESFDEAAFLSPHVFRAVSKCYENNPGDGVPAPGSTTSRPNRARPCSVGTRDWRGRVWLPVNCLVIRQVVILERFFGDDYKLAYLTGSGQLRTFGEIARDLVQPGHDLHVRLQAASDPPDVQQRGSVLLAVVGVQPLRDQPSALDLHFAPIVPSHCPAHHRHAHVFTARRTHHCDRAERTTRCPQPGAGTTLERHAHYLAGPFRPRAGLRQPHASERRRHGLCR